MIVEMDNATLDSPANVHRLYVSCDRLMIFDLEGRSLLPLSSILDRRSVRLRP